MRCNSGGSISAILRIVLRITYIGLMPLNMKEERDDMYQAFPHGCRHCLLHCFFVEACYMRRGLETPGMTCRRSLGTGIKCSSYCKHALVPSFFHMQKSLIR